MGGCTWCEKGRQHTNKKNELKGKDFSEDNISDMLDDLQKMIDKYAKKVDEAIDVKSKEVMTV